MSKTIHWLMAGLFVLSCSPAVRAQSQQALPLRLEQLYSLADDNSRLLDVGQKGVEAAHEGVKAAQSAQLPDISTSLSGSFLGNGVVWDRHFRNAQSVHIPHWGNNFALKAEQVIYAGGAIQSGIAMAQLQEQMAQLDLDKNRQELRFLLTGHYLNLMALHNEACVIDQNIALTELLLKHMQSRYEQGTVLKTDITRYELQLERLRLQRTKVADERQIANYQLVTTLHLPADTQIVPDTTLTDRTLSLLTERQWQQLAESQNLGLKQASTAVEMGREAVRQQRADRLPHVAAVAEEHLAGPIPIAVPTLNNKFTYWFVGLGVSYNISSLFKNKKLRQAKVQLQQAQAQELLAREETDRAVEQGYTNYCTALKELDTQLKSVQLANENYATTEKRYRNQLALLTDMIDASNVKLDAELALVNARINVVYHYYMMKYITHTL